MLKTGWPLVALLTLTSAALARPIDPKLSETKERYDRGLAHFNLQEYKLAIVEFEAAYRLKPDPVFLFNLAQSHRLDQNHERALYFYGAYLRASPNAPNAKEVERRIATLQKLISDKSTVAAPPDHTLAPGDPRASVPEPAPRTTPPVAVAAVPAERALAPVKRPLYKQWWLWTVTGLVVAGAAVGIGVGVSANSGGAVFDAGLGTFGPGK